MSKLESHISHEQNSNERSFRFLQLNLAGALSIVIIAATLIVVVAYSLYWNDSDRKYDIARGGKTSENQVLNLDESSVDRTSPVDSNDAKQKLEYLQQELEALRGLADFNPEDLSDQNLRLVAPSEPSL